MLSAARALDTRGCPWKCCPVRLVIADDVALMRDGLARLLSDRAFASSRPAATRRRCTAASSASQPDAAIVDIRMPPTHTDEGLVAAQEIRERHPSVGGRARHHLEPRYAMRLLEALSASAAGYLLKDRVADVAVLADALHRIAEGECVIDPTIVSRLLKRAARGGPLGELTVREREVLGLMAEGRSNEGIAAELFLSARRSRPTSARSSSSSACASPPRATGACSRCCATCATRSARVPRAQFRASPPIRAAPAAPSVATMRHTLLITALALTSPPSAAAPAGATFPGHNGPIAFRQSIRDRPRRAVPRAPERHPVTRAHRSPGFFSDWRADGRRIAFDFFEPDGDEQIATMAPDGSDLRVITSGPGIHEVPSWSPGRPPHRLRLLAGARPRDAGLRDPPLDDARRRQQGQAAADGSARVRRRAQILAERPLDRVRAPAITSNGDEAAISSSARRVAASTSSPPGGRSSSTPPGRRTAAGSSSTGPRAHRGDPPERPRAPHDPAGD